MLSFSVLGSGSSGNATLIRGERGSILIDCGFSLRQMQSRLNMVGCEITEIEAILITHEHGDHIYGLKKLVETYSIPVFMTRGTYNALYQQLGQSSEIQIIRDDESFRLGEFLIQPFMVTHDAQEPVNYVVIKDGVKLGFATDCGYPSSLMIHRLKDCDGLILESNHCPEMLMKGFYPYPVKQRIKSRLGHLSNYQMLQLLNAVIHEGLQALVIAHVSENNNRPEIVMESLERILEGKRISLWIASQHHPTPIIHLRSRG